jgi:hypothetical protein
MNQLALDLQPADLSYRLIPLTQGQFAKVDAVDYDFLTQWKWCAQWDPKSGQFHATRCYWVQGRKSVKHVQMARLIMGNPVGMEVDHANGNTLDNRRSTNLRLATHAQNCQNRRRKSDNTSGVKGVHWNKESRKWRARIMAHGKRKLIGDFGSLADAQAAYAVAAREAHGEFARLA